MNLFILNLQILAYAAWLGFGGLINRPYIYKYPTTTVGCNITDINILSNLSSPVYDPTTWDPQSHYRLVNLYIISDRSLSVVI